MLQILKNTSDEITRLQQQSLTEDNWHSNALIYGQIAIDNALVKKSEIESAEKSVKVFEGAIKSLNVKRGDDLQNCSVASLNFINSLPSNSLQPQLIAYDPPFILIQPGNPNIHLKLMGAFPKNSSISLCFGNEYQPIFRSFCQLQFVIPQDDLFANPSSLCLKTGELKILSSSSIIDLFKITIRAIPSSPGKVDIDYFYTQPRTVTDRYPYSSGTLTVSSKKEFGNDDQHLESTVYPDPERYFDINTVSIEMIQSEGKPASGNDENDYHGPHIIEKTAAYIKLFTTTRHHVKGTSGHRVFRVNAKQLHTYDVKDTIPITAHLSPLDWQTTKTWTFPRDITGTQTVKFTPFQGSTQTFTQSMDTRYVKIVFGSAGIDFITPKPIQG